MENFNLILPEIFIALSIMFLLVLGVFKKESSKLVYNISQLILLITAVITINETFAIDRVTLFSDSVVIDHMSSLMKIITLIGAFLVLTISTNYLKLFKTISNTNNKKDQIANVTDGIIRITLCNYMNLLSKSDKKKTHLVLKKCKMIFI